MPRVFLSPSTQYFNEYSTKGNERYYMNLIADAMEPYLRASGIAFTRNNPDGNAADAIRDSNAGNYNVHIALHSNASPPHLRGQLRGIDVYYSPFSVYSEKLAAIIANNMRAIYPIPDRPRIMPTTTLGEVTWTKAVAVLAELGYHDNIEDETWIRGNINAIAKNLVQSLTEYFGIPFISAGAVRYGTVVTDGSGLNIRNFPSPNGHIIGIIPNGSIVTVYGETGAWYVVNWNGIIGYSSSPFIVI